MPRTHPVRTAKPAAHPRQSARAARERARAEASTPAGRDRPVDTLRLSWWARVEGATPADRDRSVDALRTIGILGVILGHWLVTALVSTERGTLADDSPLATMPLLAPVSWLLQTLSVFFLVGGYAAAKSRHGDEPYASWLRRRMARLVRPLPALVLAWVPLMAMLWCAGMTPRTLLALLRLVGSPLWFLGVYAGLTALTPVAAGLWDRLGGYGVAGTVGVVAAVDLVRFGLGGPVWLGWTNVAAGWLVPYLLGVAWARGTFARWTTPVAMLAGGVLATVLLMLYAGYPAAMVGVPGHRVSNLNPPTLAAVTFGLAQAGLALLLRKPLVRLMRRPRVWAPVALANLSAMTLFLWHQTAMLVTTIMLLSFGALPGLHEYPAGPGWVGARLLWLPIFATVLGCCLAVFGRYERSR